MRTNKARGNATRRLLASAALVAAATTVPMVAVTAPAVAVPTPGPGVVQTDCGFDFDSGYVSGNQWTNAGKPWGGHGWGGHGWGGHGHGWGCGWGNPWFFLPPGLIGSS